MRQSAICAGALLGSIASTTVAAGPVAQRCANTPLANNTKVACVNHYAAVLPEPFKRAYPSNGQEPANDTFAQTSVPADPSFELVSHADFLVFDAERGAAILGADPRLDFVFATRNDSVHEAPVYVPALDSIIYSLPHQGIYEQQIVHLNNGSAPTLANYTTTPPVYAVNGGRLFNGSIVWAVEGGVPFPAPNGSGATLLQSPGLYRLDPVARTVAPLLNNYFGTQFNSPNDVVVQANGDIFFTDSWYGYAINVTAPPVLPAATWRFRPSTGRAAVVDTSIQQPNGLGIAPDGRTLYVTDTGVTDFAAPPPPGVLPRYSYDPRGGRAVYAFDLVDGPAGSTLANRRPVWLAEEFADDGFHVAAAGWLVGAAGRSVDILSPDGELLVKIVTNYTVNNIQFAGPRRDQLWLFGMGGISRVALGISGMPQE